MARWHVLNHSSASETRGTGAEYLGMGRVEKIGRAMSAEVLTPAVALLGVNHRSSPRKKTNSSICKGVKHGHLLDRVVCSPNFMTLMIGETKSLDSAKTSRGLSELKWCGSG